MRQSRYSDSQIMTILKLNEHGVSVSDLCREHGMSTAMFYKRPLNPLLIDSVKNGGITNRLNLKFFGVSLSTHNSTSLDAIVCD